MADLARIKRNVAKMASQDAPIEDIDGYIASEGVSIDDVRNFSTAKVAAPTEGAAGEFARSASAMTQNPAKAQYDAMTDETERGAFVGEYRKARGISLGDAVAELFSGKVAPRGASKAAA